MKPQYDPTEHWAPLADGVLECRAWCLDNVERVTDKPALINAAAVRLREERDLNTLRDLLGALRAAKTLDDVIAVFSADSANASGGAPAFAETGR